jgi:hypothetical protein
MIACRECSGEIEDKVYVMYAAYRSGRRLFESNQRYMICESDFKVIPERLKSSIPGKKGFVFEESAATGDSFPALGGRKLYVDDETVATYLPLTYKLAGKQSNNPDNYDQAGKISVFTALKEMLRLKR